MERTVKSILSAMSSVNAPQMKFILILFDTLMLFQGKATFRNLSRYSGIHEKTFSRWYRRAFNYVEFNQRLFDHELPQAGEYIAAIDASFIRKSGKRTEGLAKFFHSGSDKAEKGLELSLISVIDLKANTGYSLDARQTIDKKGVSRVERYANQVVSLLPELKKRQISYLVADAYYSKTTFINAVCGGGLHFVGKLRNDANMRWLYSGEYSGKGRPKAYDGKVFIHKQLEHFEYEGQLDDGVEVYSAVVNLVAFKRSARVVLLRWNTRGKVGTALLFSSNTEEDAMTIVSYYKARFQIEFIFRDAKQFTGLMDCQARCKEAIHTHINASLTALNLLKLEDRQHKQTHDETVISIASWRRKKFNQNFMAKLFSTLGLSKSCPKIVDVYEEFRDYGCIAA